MSYRLGVDIGGTFTDFVAYDQDGKALKAWKNLSTPQNPMEGIMTGLRAFGAIDAISGIRLGTTVATNALLEGKGATVAYVTTRGFKDVPFIGRGNRRHHYDLAWVKPKPFVQRRHAFEVDERVGPSGETIQPLDETQVRTLARDIKAGGKINAIAVVLLHSYLAPDHEQRIKAIFAEEIPDIPVSISYEVLPKWKEHFRSSTTICDAFIKPVVERQLGGMRRELDEHGIGAKVVVMRSNGGEITLDKAVETPIQIAVSGPTGGVINGKEKFTTDFEIEWGRPIQIPMIDIRTIGAGGGSIARIDAGGMLVVGPESAGANPGPACYRRDGALPTVTDANVVLGRISAQNFLGGTMSLDAEAAREVVATIGDALGMSVEQAALAIVKIANNNMVGALHTVLTEQGLDPRDFVLVAFGGAGPLHITDLMTEASIPKGLVPNFPGQFSAFGFTMANARVDRYRTVQLNSRFFDAERARRAMAALVNECRGDLAAQGHVQVTITRAVEIRYLGQNYELEIPIDIDAFTEGEVAQLFQAFNEQHDARFGFRLDDHMEIVNFLVTGTANTGELAFPEITKAEGQAAAGSKRPVWFDQGCVDTPVYDRDSLRAGHTIAGPALVEENASVTVLGPGNSLSVDRFGNLLITTN
jgi:N-methylhydantoinase A